MLLTQSKRSLRALAMLLVCFMVLTPLAGSRIFVTAALQRGEFYASASLPGHVSARLTHGAAFKHAAGAEPARNVSSLNLFLHLSGILVPEVLVDRLARADAAMRGAVITALPDWQLVFAIFEPPRRCCTLP